MTTPSTCAIPYPTVSFIPGTVSGVGPGGGASTFPSDAVGYSYSSEQSQPVDAPLLLLKTNRSDVGHLTTFLELNDIPDVPLQQLQLPKSRRVALSGLRLLGAPFIVAVHNSFPLTFEVWLLQWDRQPYVGCDPPIPPGVTFTSAGARFQLEAGGKARVQGPSRWQITALRTHWASESGPLARRVPCIVEASLTPGSNISEDTSLQQQLLERFNS